MALSREKKKAYAAILETLGKRPRAVLEKILENGCVSTYELGELGYDQPPRAAQDLKESGVRLKTTFGKHPASGARMAIYFLDEDADTTALGGRRAFPSKFRAEVAAKYGSRCNLCDAPYPSASLSLDHRVPYIVGGEPETLKAEDFQLLCGSHQRKKSWECEHCPNRTAKDVSVCGTCFWAYPDSDFAHVATLQVRRLDLTFSGADDVTLFDRLRKTGAKSGASPGDVVKQLIREFVNRK
jgi:hypothetical protein